MRKSSGILLTLASALLLAAPLPAEVQTGTISGTIVDTKGSPLPGVTVELKSPEMQGSRIAVTRPDGTFRHAALPPGTYSVSYRLGGFSPVDEAGVAVRIATETQRRVTMSAGIKDTITVSGQRVIVDTTKSTVDTHVDWKLVDSLPNNRKFQDIMLLAPGVAVTGTNPRVNGGSDWDNQYLIDGVDTTDPLWQAWGTQINYDSIAEVQVQTAGMNAEYGRVVGGLINLVTKSGGNDFHGTLRVIRDDVGWVAKPKPGHGAVTGWSETRPEATLGGPIVKDRLWFFLAGERGANQRLFNRETGSGTGVFKSDTVTTKRHYLSGKLTLQATPSNSLIAYYHEDPGETSNLLLFALGPSVSPRSDATQTFGAKVSSLHWLSMFSTSTYLEAQAHSFANELQRTPDGPLGPEPTTLDVATGYWSGTVADETFSDHKHRGVQVALSRFLDTNLGSHQIKAGVQYLAVQNTGQDVYYPSGGLDSPGYLLLTYNGTYLELYKVYNRAGKLETKDPYYAIYAQDSWQKGNLTVNYGLRAEQLSLINNIGQTTAKFNFDQAIAPRLGFAYDLHGNSLHGSASRFYDTIPAAVAFFGSVYNEKMSAYFWAPSYGYACSDPTQDPTGNVHSDCWIQYGDFGLWIGNGINPNLKPAHIDEYTLGYDQRLTDNMSAGVNLISWTQRDVIEDFDSGTNGDGKADDGLYYINNVPGAWKKYQALQLSLQKRYSENHIQFVTSWTHAFTNEGYHKNDKVSPYGDSSVALVNRYGKLNTPDLFKFAGSYTLPWGSLPTSTTFGIWAYYYTGPYYIFTQSVPTPKGYQDEYQGRGKVGSQWDIDLHLQQDIAAFKSLKLSLYANFFNLTNNQAPTNRNGTVASPNFGQPIAWQTPRRYQIGAKIEF